MGQLDLAFSTYVMLTEDNLSAIYLGLDLLIIGLLVIIPRPFT